MSDDLNFPFLANRIADRTGFPVIGMDLGTGDHQSDVKRWDRIITNLFEIGFRLEENGTIWVDDEARG